MPMMLPHLFPPKSLHIIRLLTGALLAGMILHPVRAVAAVPAVVADAEQQIGFNLYGPQEIAVAPNGNVYVADTLNNRIVQIVPNLPEGSTQTKVRTGTRYTLTAPVGVAVDSAGDLFIADNPGSILGGARILEIVASGGVLTTTVNLIYQGGLLSTPTTITLYGSSTLLVGESTLVGAAVYSINLASRTPTPVSLGITFPGGFTVSGLAVDSSNNLFASNSTGGGGVYVAPVSGNTSAQAVLTGSFNISSAEGLALDSSGNLFVLSAVAGGSAQVIDIPNASATIQPSPYLIPTSDLSTGGGIALDPSGNLDIAELGTLIFGLPAANNGLVTQLNFSNPVNLGSVAVYGNGTAVVFNYAFNVPVRFTGFQAVTIGDLGASSDVTDLGARNSGDCRAQTVKGVTQYAPYICYESFQATPVYVGTRVSAIQVLGASPAVLSSTPVFELGMGAAQASYPLDVTSTHLGLVQPQGVAISGFDKTVYVADQVGGKVYKISGLNGSSATVVSTGSSSASALAAPVAIAINGEGDLFVADFNLAKIVVIPTTTGISPFVLNTGSLLKHPFSLALDEYGDLYVGDAGPDGYNASASSPGFVVAVPYRGQAFKLTLGVPVIYPQALAVNNITGDLLIGDGGDVSTLLGQVVKLTAGGATSVVPITNPAVITDPAGLTFDAAGNLYVLDGVLNNITVVSPNGSSSLLLGSNTGAINAGSAMASSAGSQSFVVTNLGGGTANGLVYLNGNSTTLAFGSQTVNTGSSTQTATVANIGNSTLTLNSTFYSPNPIPNFALAPGETCAGGLTLTASSPSCAFTLEFGPTIVGAINQTAQINSDAYNNGTPLITLTGTGTAQGHVANTKMKDRARAVPESMEGHPSFAEGRRASRVR